MAVPFFLWAPIVGEARKYNSSLSVALKALLRGFEQLLKAIACTGNGVLIWKMRLVVAKLGATTRVMNIV